MLLVYVFTLTGAPEYHEIDVAAVFVVYTYDTLNTKIIHKTTPECKVS